MRQPWRPRRDAPDPAELIYSPAELAALPTGAANASLGCGNPTAIAGLKPGEVVLDLGSGGGIDCFLAAQKVGPTGRVIGLDMTPDMIRLAQRNAKKAGLTNVEFRLGEMEDMPLPDATVDVIISNCVINLSPDKDAVFREAYRVLRPGGRMSISDMVVSHALPAVIRGQLDAWAACIAGALPESDYLGKIRAAGFEDVTVVSRDAMSLAPAGAGPEEMAAGIARGPGPGGGGGAGADARSRAVAGGPGRAGGQRPGVGAEAGVGEGRLTAESAEGYRRSQRPRTSGIAGCLSGPFSSSARDPASGLLCLLCLLWPTSRLVSSTCSGRTAVRPYRRAGQDRAPDLSAPPRKIRTRLPSTPRCAIIPGTPIVRSHPCTLLPPATCATMSSSSSARPAAPPTPPRPPAAAKPTPSPAPGTVTAPG